MKQDTNWRIDRRKSSLKILDAKYNVVASLYSEGNAEENANIICKAVNSYDSLIEQNKQLLEALKAIKDLKVETSMYGQYITDVRIIAKEAINKA